MADELLEQVEKISLRNSGALHEGDIFSILANSPFVVRSGEFAVVDGALDCTRTYNTATSWATRYWVVNDWAANPLEASSLMSFEVKSCLVAEAGSQLYITTIAQRRRAAFYIARLTADPTWVELIPNYHQDEGSLDPEGAELETDADEHLINFTRRSFMPPRSYGGVDPTGSSYRMPLFALSEAVRRAHLHCTVAGHVYVNPWTDVAFPHWHPLVGESAKWIRPREDGGVFTAHEAVMKLIQDFNYNDGGVARASGNSFEIDFVGLQPSLGDFKILVRGPLAQLAQIHTPSKSVITEPQGQVLQYVIQHKIEGRVRRSESMLTRVKVCRGSGRKDKRKLRYFFEAFERFCFFFYVFEFSTPRGDPPRYEFFFLPERVIPQDFYVSRLEEVSFSKREFEPYRFHMDEQGRWIDSVRKVIEDNPQPRKAGCRPNREVSPALDDGETALRPERTEKHLGGGSNDHKVVNQDRHRLLYYSLMAECATRLCGVIVVLATKQSFGDFAYAQYKWSTEERDAFLERGRPPVTIDDLPPDACLVYLCYNSRYVQSSFNGMLVTSAQFRRINSCKAHRLLLWDNGGFDTMERHMVPAIIPSEDVQPTEPQRCRFKRNEGKRNARQPMPSISGLLSTGLYAAEYAIGNGGPAVWDGAEWGEVWKLLDAFATCEQVEHPQGMRRDASQYRHTVRAMNTRTAEEHFHIRSDMQSHLRTELEEDD